MGKNDDGSLVTLGRKPRLKAETGVKSSINFRNPRTWHKKWCANLSACPAHCSQRRHEDQLKSHKLCWEQPTSQKGAPSAYTVWTPATWPLFCRIPEVSEPAVHCAVTAGTPRTPLPACPAQEPLPTSPCPPSLRGPPTRRPLHWVTGSWEDPRGSEGPQLRQSGQGCGCPTPASQHCEASAPSFPSINRIPGWGSEKAPPPPAVQTWRPGQAHVQPELSDTWSPRRRTWGWGACGAGARVRLGRTWQGARGAGGTWRPQQAHVGHMGSLSGTQPGTCPRGPWGRVRIHPPAFLVQMLFPRHPGASVSAGLPPRGPQSPGWSSQSAQRVESAVSSQGLGWSFPC